ARRRARAARHGGARHADRPRRLDLSGARLRADVPAHGHPPRPRRQRPRLPLRGGRGVGAHRTSLASRSFMRGPSQPPLPAMEPLVAITRGDGPLVAAALHAGHAVRPDLLPHLALADDERLREEDPFTEHLATVAPTRIVGLRSRFEVDLDRPPEHAVYRTPEEA